MITSLVKVGRSYFVYIPDALWEKAGLPKFGYVELTAKKDKVIIKAAEQKSPKL